MRGVARRVVTSSPWNRVGKQIVVLGRRKGIDADVKWCTKPSWEANDTNQAAHPDRDADRGRTRKPRRAWKTDLVDPPIRRPADAESPQWRKGPAHKPQLVRDSFLVSTRMRLLCTPINDADAVSMRRSKCNACGTRYRRTGILTPLQSMENRRRPTSLQRAMKSQKELRCCPTFQGIEGPPLVTQ